MGGNQEGNRGNNQEAEGRTQESFGTTIEFLYDKGIQLGMSYKEMYELDLSELINTIQERQKGLAYQIWRLASLTRHPWVKNFPEKPEDACPELFPKPKGIPMPDFLKQKYIERSK